MNKDIAILREVVGKLTQMLAGMGLRVTQQGSMAYVESDPKTNKPVRVNIPYLPDNASEALILAIQGFIDHEVAHILFTDWKSVQKAYKVNARLGILHNIVEDTFIERAIGKRFPGSVHNLGRLHDFFVTNITAPALEKAPTPLDQFGVLLVPICRAWSGQKVFQDYLDKNKHWDHPLVKAFVDKVKPATIKAMPKIENSWQSLEIAEEFFNILHSKTSESKDEGDEGKDGASKPSKEPSKKPTKADKGEGEGEHTEPPKPSEEKAESKPDKGESSDEGKAEPDPNADADPDGESEDGSDEDGSGKGKSSDDEKDDGKGGATSEFDPNDPGEEIDTERFDENSDGSGEDDTTGSSGGEDDEDADQDGDGDDTKIAQGAESTGGKSDPFKDANFEATGFEDALTKMITDETTRQTKGADYVIFSKDFDIIAKHEVSPRYLDQWLIDLDENTRHMVGVMQKDVERMMAQRSQVVNVPGYRSGRLHSSGLHRLTVNDDRVFRRKQEAHSKDTAVCLLVDNSGSMMGRKTEVAMSAAFALSSTLERVKIAHECIGFTTGFPTRSTSSLGYNRSIISAEETRVGRRFSRVEPVYMPIYKGFEERLTPAVKKRFADVVGCQNFLANNIDGEAVEVATQRLMKRKERRRVLIVLSDGFPAADGNITELYSHLHKSVEDAGKMGVEVIGIGIQSNAVKTFYPKYVVLEDLTKLPTTVMGEIKRILTAA